MTDRVIFSLFIIPIIAWGIISILKPEFALKYTLGNAFKKVKPNKYFLMNIKISGLISIFVGCYIVYVIMSGRLGL